MLTVTQGEIMDAYTNNFIIESSECEICNIRNTVASIADQFEIMEVEKKIISETYRHSVRTAMLALAIVRNYNFLLEFHDQIVKGALLHDIGKLKVPKDILRKKAELNNSEKVWIALHPILGEQLFESQFAKDEVIQDIIVMHHEKLNGAGYPKQKKEIPLYVQLVTVCDMYEAMTSRRPYKKPYTHEFAISLLERDAMKGKLNMQLVKIVDSIGEKILGQSCIN